MGWNHQLVLLNNTTPRFLEQQKKVHHKTSTADDEIYRSRQFPTTLRHLCQVWRCEHDTLCWLRELWQQAEDFCLDGLGGEAFWTSRLTKDVWTWFVPGHLLFNTPGSLDLCRKCPGFWRCILSISWSALGFCLSNQWPEVVAVQGEAGTQRSNIYVVTRKKKRKAEEMQSLHGAFRDVFDDVPSRELTYPFEVCCNENNEMFPRRKNPPPGGKHWWNPEGNGKRQNSTPIEWPPSQLVGVQAHFPLQKELKRFSTVFFGFEVKHVVS